MVIKSSPNMVNKRTYFFRLRNRFFTQGILIGIAIILGILITHLLLRHILVREALAQEADYFWQFTQENPDALLAKTKNMRVFLLPRDAHLLPKEAHLLQPGYHEYFHLKDFNVAYLTENSQGLKLLILFNRSGVDSLVWLFGILPLSLALIVLYISLFFSYLYTKKLLSPAIKLAEKIRHTDLLKIDKSFFSSKNRLFSQDDDIATIATAFGELAERIENFVERERNFTRDVSHELRSSMTVIKMAGELLAASCTQAQGELLDKINRATKDMEELTQFFLILAREESLKPIETSILVNDIVSAEADKLSLLSQQKDVPIFIENKDLCRVKVPEKVLSVLIGNLLRNSLLYTETGRILVTLSTQSITVSDTGIGISKEKLATIFDCFERDEGHLQDGFGIGLSIVKRLCNKFNWSLDLKSQKHKGTTIVVVFLS